MARLRILLASSKIAYSAVCKRSLSSQQLVYHEHGDPEKILSLEKNDIDPSGLGKDEVLVRWNAAPINPADINQLQGVYAVKPPLPAVGGNEGCATVESVGSGVRNLRAGDRVIPARSGLGTWRTLGVHKEDALFRIDSDIPLLAASTFQVNPPTAYRMLKDFVSLRGTDVVLQNGANSAVGRYVIQLCRIWGIQTVNVIRDRPDVNDLKGELKSLGANEVLTEEEFIKASRGMKGVRLALNCVGGRSSLVLAKTLDEGGYMVTYGGMSKQPVQTPTGSFIFADITLKGFWMSKWYDRSENSKERSRMYDELGEWFERGELKTPAIVEHSVQNFSSAITAATSSSNCKHVFVFTG